MTLTRRHFIMTGTALFGSAATAQAAQDFDLADRFKVRVVPIKESVPAGEIHVTPWNYFLYHARGNGEALRYGIAVGPDGSNFEGEAIIERKVEWPTWTPTPEMLERDPAKYTKWENGMPGGPENPLGARAMYLYENGRDTLFRIHGTPQPWSIGRPASSGCVRMVNPHVEHLYKRVPIGTKVVVHGGSA